jgi:predicted nucleotidyltransferase
MGFDFDIDDRTILRVKHGSQAYGTNIASSDLDIKGVAIEPLSHQVGFLRVFEQFEQMGKAQGSNLHKSRALAGQDVDLVIYSLKKFTLLAANCNPNIIEVLHVDESDILFQDEFGARLRSLRNDFISKKARHTFAGYAHAQLKRIKTHRAWLLDPPRSPPTRATFGLSETSKVSQSELGAFDAALAKGIEIEMSKEVLTLFTREKQYQGALTHWHQYQEWVKSRNPARAELEAKYGYDTKHGMHLIRLMRMCKEILAEGKVYVKRHDVDDLRRIRAGWWDYDRLVDEADRLETECEALYQTSPLPRDVDRVKLDNAIVELTLDYFKAKGA